jgi:DNA repair exonuclease SbcCD ATPase subunit
VHTPSQRCHTVNAHPLTLRDAAEQLGIRPQALRMRIKRDAERGTGLFTTNHDENGKLYVTINTPSQPVDAQPVTPSNPPHDIITEYQLREIQRLKTELEETKGALAETQQRYSRAVEDAAEERRQLYQQRERDQVLQQQMQNLLEQLQENAEALKRLPPPQQERLDQLEAAHGDLQRDHGMLKGGVVQLLHWIERKV